MDESSVGILQFVCELSNLSVSLDYYGQCIDAATLQSIILRRSINSHKKKEKTPYYKPALHRTCAARKASQIRNSPVLLY